MSAEPLRYTQADLTEARTLVPELSSKAQERIARALAERDRASVAIDRLRRERDEARDAATNLLSCIGVEACDDPSCEGRGCLAVRRILALGTEVRRG